MQQGTPLIHARPLPRCHFLSPSLPISFSLCLCPRPFPTHSLTCLTHVNEPWPKFFFWQQHFPFLNFGTMGVFLSYLSLIFMLMCLCAEHQKPRNAQPLKMLTNGSGSGSDFDSGSDCVSAFDSLAVRFCGHKESVLLENLCFLCFFWALINTHVILKLRALA